MQVEQSAELVQMAIDERRRGCAEVRGANGLYHVGFTEYELRCATGPDDIDRLLLTNADITVGHKPVVYVVSAPAELRDRLLTPPLAHLPLIYPDNDNNFVNPWLYKQK